MYSARRHASWVTLIVKIFSLKWSLCWFLIRIYLESYQDLEVVGIVKIVYIRIALIQQRFESHVSTLTLSCT